MKTGSLFMTGMLAVAGLLGGCDVPPEPTLDSQAAAVKVTQTGKLNLSHIECTSDGQVLAHFVLLFGGPDQPGALTGTYNGGAFGPVPASKSSGNVWHYNVLLPSGAIDILSATTTTAGGVCVNLHNPGAYAGTYQCTPCPEVCPVVVQAQDVYCSDAPLGNPGAECGNFGLVPQGKDDGLSGTSFVATQSAYVAIVKSGTAGCGPGSSAYRIYTNVTAGMTLLTPVTQNISHVTYCACPQ